MKDEKYKDNNRDVDKEDEEKMERMRKPEQERKITSEDKQNLVSPPIIFTNTGRV